jgi:hypothetical protein
VTGVQTCALPIFYCKKWGKLATFTETVGNSRYFTQREISFQLAGWQWSVISKKACTHAHMHTCTQIYTLPKSLTAVWTCRGSPLNRSGCITVISCLMEHKSGIEQVPGVVLRSRWSISWSSNSEIHNKIHQPATEMWSTDKNCIFISPISHSTWTG